MTKTNLITILSALLLVVGLSAFTANQTTSGPGYEFTSFTTVESIIPNGLGRSRIINALSQRDYKEFTTVKSEDDKTRNKSDRGEIRVKNYEETKLLNFFNVAGIRFQNIAANDAVINSKVNDMLNQGWEVVNIVSGVESVGGKDDANGIFITRFYFKRPKL